MVGWYLTYPGDKGHEFVDLLCLSPGGGFSWGVISAVGYSSTMGKIFYTWCAYPGCRGG